MCGSALPNSPGAGLATTSASNRNLSRNETPGASNKSQTMSKFNLFADEPNLAQTTLRGPVKSTPAARVIRTVTATPNVTPVFVLGVTLWFVAMFAVGELILMR